MKPVENNFIYNISATIFMQYGETVIYSGCLAYVIVQRPMNGQIIKSYTLTFGGAS